VSKPFSRRTLLQGVLLPCSLGAFALYLGCFAPRTRRCAPSIEARNLRNFEVVTTVQLRDPLADATIWVPVPTVNTPWQRSLSSETSGNAEQTAIEVDSKSGARFAVAQFKADTPSPSLQVTSRVQTMDRAVDWKSPQTARETATLRRWVQPSALVPTDASCASSAADHKGAHTDVDKSIESMTGSL